MLKTTSTALGLRAYVGLRQREVRRFLASAKRAAELQREVLFSKLRREMDSDFGRDHRFDQIRTIADFRRHVPLTDYEYFRPYVERVKQGDVRAMFGPDTKVLMFAMTSGTTSESKYIPITNHFFQEYRRGWNVWGMRTYHQHPELLRTKTLQFSSDWQQTRTEGGFYCGNISGLAAETRPAVSDLIFCLPTALNKIPDAESKQYTALRLAMPVENVGILITANPLTLIGLARLGDERRDTLIRDIHDGTLDRNVQLPEEVRKRLQRQFDRAHPKRARALEKIVEQTGHLWPRDYWKQLAVLAVWTGGSVAAYLPQVQDYFGDVTFRDHGLSASEGRMTIPLEANSPAGVLDVGSQYFEFIPEAEHESANPTILEAHELERDQNYYLVMSTSSALWRHDIHDVVRCVGFEGQAPILEFLNKGAHYSSMTGEKLSEHQVVTAVRDSLKELGQRIEHFTLAPVFGDPPHYELLIESTMDTASEQRLAAAVDRRLAEVNCEYENRVATRRLDPVVVRRLPAGTWRAFHRRALTRRGASVEQFKHPCLTNDQDFITQLPAPASTA
ncbi:GH3 auxin-responsive promoter family protein [Candidatus Laterigemmans baculatus]|uniref:GH3 auxin-responsive promoter family protein n=1 Tax=Candidatus Laterigemmans baculatus TaxID=2770505 RepID=UPI0013DC32EC|nr:GH3 auxin-responsive promoter family protein [Candidatus Laterigemmans baculatus]